MAEDSNDKGFDMSFSRLLQPDFSAYIREGEFCGLEALTLHLFTADYLLRTAIAMTTPGDISGLQDPEERLFVIEMNLKTYREAVEAAVTEVNRLSRTFPLSYFPRTKAAAGID